MDRSSERPHVPSDQRFHLRNLLGALPAAALHLFADSRCLLWVNGKPAETDGVGTTCTARAGRQSLVAADPWCARCVTVTCLSEREKILGLKMTERRYPLERVGSFKSSDPFLDRLREMSVNTIGCTSDDACGSDARERNERVQDAAKASFSTTRKWSLSNCRNPGQFHCGGNPDMANMIALKCGLDMPVMFYRAFHQLYQMNDSAMDREALDEMRRRWKYMAELQQDAGTPSEKFVSADGGGASESCHNYGAVPAWFLSSFVLGVRRDGPAWEKKLIIEPRLADLTNAEGVVATEFGPVPVCWKRDGNLLSFQFEVPPGVTASVRIPDGDVKTWRMSGIFEPPVKTGRCASVSVTAGRYQGSVRISVSPSSVIR